jgi:formate hydrogenlyase transcriptional activator
MPNVDQACNGLGFFSSEAVLDILKLILAGSELSEVLTIVARLVESQGKGTLCTIWFPDADGGCGNPGGLGAAAQTRLLAEGASCGTAVYRRDPVYVADIPQEPSWDDYRDRVVPFGILAVWSRPCSCVRARSSAVLQFFTVSFVILTVAICS